MAGGAIKYRHLSRSSAHRQALLRNMVDSLFEYESIKTTWHKAKEAQRLAEKLITLAKRNTDASKLRAKAIFYRPHLLVPKLFGPIRTRYESRPGGYTRVLRIEPLKEDQAPSAILELVDSPRDMRFAMTARTLAAQQSRGEMPNEITRLNIKKVTRYRADGKTQLQQMVDKMKELHVAEQEGREKPEPKTKLLFPDSIELEQRLKKREERLDRAAKRPSK